MNEDLRLWQQKMLGIIGSRVTTGSRPYPYIYKSSKGKVTHIEFHENLRRCVFYTDEGESFPSWDWDLTSAYWGMG
jgi:hypothetical protein